MAGKLIIVVLLIFAGGWAWGQEQSTHWTGDIRIRGELDGRDFRNATPPNIYSLLRVRLGVNASPLSGVELVAMMQGSGVFGEPRTLSGFSPASKNVDLLEGYVKLDNMVLTGLTVQAGRMQLSYGNQRLISPSDWSNVGRSFDGLRFAFANDVARIDAFIANTVETHVPPAPVTASSVAATRDSGQLFSGVYGVVPLGKELTLDAFVLHDLNRHQTVAGTNDMHRWTMGTRFAGRAGSLFLDVEAAYQTGTRSRTDIAAYMVASEVGWSLPDLPLSAVSVGYEYLSGTAAGEDRYHSFDPLYSSGHAQHGALDYFTQLPSLTAERGLQDAFVRTRFVPAEAITATLAAHYFRLSESWGGMQPLGSELHTVVTWSHTAHSSLEFGGGAFFPGSVMRAWFDGRDVGLWGYTAIRAWF